VLSMFPLAIGLSLDVYLIGRMIFDSVGLGAALAIALFGLLMAFGWPCRGTNAS
jgi:hypothetical protein